jgi:hypothetical protein
MMGPMHRLEPTYKSTVGSNIDSVIDPTLDAVIDPAHDAVIDSALYPSRNLAQIPQDFPSQPRAVQCSRP